MTRSSAAKSFVDAAACTEAMIFLAFAGMDGYPAVAKDEQMVAKESAKVAFEIAELLVIALTLELSRPVKRVRLE